MATYLYSTDILKFKVQVIAQQLNCVTTVAKGLSKQIADTYPFADFYTNRETPSKPGTIELRGDRTTQWVLGMYAQYYPGVAKHNNDNVDLRVGWFQQCLGKVAKIKNLRSIAFPARIGCGLAGGDWEVYSKMLDTFAKNNPTVKVYVVDLEEETQPDPVLEVTDETPGTWSTTTLAEYTSANIPDGYQLFFEEALDPKYGSITAISRYLETEDPTCVYPPLDRVYAALVVKPEDVRVLILGQDPFFHEGQAIGICFAVPEGVPAPPSLKNIHKELATEGFAISGSGTDLTPWVNQGVLMLNTALTVRAGSAGSHSKEWLKEFTPGLLRWLNAVCGPMVVVMWGNHAQSFAGCFGTKHRKVMSAHPSPLSASRGFFGSKPFSKTNQHLRSLGYSEIDWSLQ